MRTHIATALAVAFLMLAASRPSLAATPGDPEPLLRATAAALGVQNLAKLTGVHERMSVAAAGLRGDADQWLRYKPFAETQNLRLGPLSQDQGFDGRDSWTRDGKGIVYVEGSIEGRGMALNDALRSSYALWAPGHGGANVSVAGTRSEKGRTFDVVRVIVPRSAVPFDLWIDAASHLPARVVETAGAVTTTTDYSDYRLVRGVRIAFVQHVTTSQGNDIDLKILGVAADPLALARNLREPVSSAHDFSIAGGTSTTLPTRLVDNHVYLDVSLNGKGPYHFIFDTGGANVIDPAVAKEIGAAPVGAVQGGGVGASTENVQFATVKSLGIGQAELSDQLFAVAPVRAGFGVASGSPVDGLIGFEVLARFVTVFDYQNNRLVLSLPGGAPAAGRRVPFVFGGTQPQLACALDGIQALCSVDTGSRSSLDLFVPFIAAHPEVVPADASAVGVNGLGVGGGQSGKLGRLKSLEIGGFTLPEMIAGLSVAQGGGFFGSGGIAANIGGGVWNRFTVTFDYPHLAMYLEPNADFARRDEYERAGLFLINKGGAFVVIDVRPGTPAAAAGLVKGDVIASLDGTPATGLTLGVVRDAFHRPSGTVVHLGIVHAGATAAVNVDVTLRDFV